MKIYLILEPILEIILLLACMTLTIKYEEKRETNKTKLNLRISAMKFVTVLFIILFLLSKIQRTVPEYGVFFRAAMIFVIFLIFGTAAYVNIECSEKNAKIQVG